MAGIEMLDDAQEICFPRDRFSELKGLPDEYLDVIGMSIYAGPGANIAHLNLELKPDTKPIRVKLRKYNDSQRHFLKCLTGQLLECGLIYENLTSKWTCAPQLAPKPGLAELRFNVGLRPVNVATYSQAFMMPLVETKLEKASEAKHLSELDMTHGYWQLLLHTSIQEYQSFITPDGIFTPTPVLHGNVNSSSHLQSGLVSEMSDELKRRLLLWVDYMAFACRTIDELLASHPHAASFMHATQLQTSSLKMPTLQ